MNKQELLYEGKAKKIFETDISNQIIVYYKDDATAFNATKKGHVSNKGVLNNEITSKLFTYLKTQGIENHFIKKLNEREQLCDKLKIFQLEFIVRNIITGSMAKRVGIQDGTIPENTIFEICYKNDDFGDPLINDHHAVAMKLATFDELQYIYRQIDKINDVLKDVFLQEGIILVDFKVEFGKDKDGNILLADEITPDTCRLWDKDTMKKLDKDRFREDLGGVEHAYIEILTRLNKYET